MTLSTPISSAWAAGTTDNTPTIPTHQADDLLVYVLHAKPTVTGTPPVFSTPTDWTAGPSNNDGTGTAQGTDAGQTWTASFYRVATATNHGNPTCTVTNGNVNLGIIYRFRKTVAGAWIRHLVYAADTTSGTAYSVTGTQPITVDDQIVVCSGLSGNNATYDATWTRSGDGTTGTVTKLAATDGNTTGGTDMRASGAWCAVTAASASPHAITWANTLSVAQLGGALLIRVGEPAEATEATTATTSHQPATSVSSTGGVAAGSTTSHAAALLIGAMAAVASVTASAHDATVISAGGTDAPATVAETSATAHQSSVTLEATPPETGHVLLLADGTSKLLLANGTDRLLLANRQSADATTTAHDATATGSVIAAAGTATATGTAYDAATTTVLPPVVGVTTHRRTTDLDGRRTTHLDGRRRTTRR